MQLQYFGNQRKTDTKSTYEFYISCSLKRFVNTFNFIGWYAYALIRNNDIDEIVCNFKFYTNKIMILMNLSEIIFHVLIRKFTCIIEQIFKSNFKHPKIAINK